MTEVTHIDGQGKVRCGRGRRPSCLHLLATVCGIFLLTSAAVAGPNAIVPRRSVGQVAIGENIAAVTKTLGRPEGGDAAMGHFLDIWTSKPAPGKVRHELDIYASMNADGSQVLVREIRVTSPWFRTAAGISTRSSLAQIRRAFPHAQRIPSYSSQNRDKPVDVYDDVQGGIGFEMRRGSQAAPQRCVGIVVHRKGRKMTQEYLPLPGSDRAKGIIHP